MSNTLFKKAVASAAALSVVLSIVSPVVGVNAADVSVDAANRLAALGIINNNSENPSAYRLNDSITRWEMAKVMLNLAGEEPNTTCEGKFSDVSAKAPNDWVCGYVEKGLELGFLSANSKFRPNDSITEAETLKMVMEALGVGLDAYDAKTWVADLTSAAVEAWVISETTTVSGLAAAKRSFVFTTSDAWVTATDGEGAATDGDLGDLGDLFGDLFGDGTGSGATSTGTTNSGSTSTGTDNNTSVKAGDLEVSLNPASLANGSTVPKSGTFVMAKLDLTAGSSDTTANSIRLKRDGLGSNSEITNVWFEKNGKRLSTKSSVLSDSYVTTSFLPDLVIKAWATETIDLVVVLSGSNAGSQHRFVIESASDVKSTGNVKGTYPLYTNSVTTANYSAATVNFSRNAAATSTVKVGDTSAVLWDFRLALGNENRDVVLKSVTLYNSGTADLSASVSNLALYNKATWEKVSTNVSVSGRYATFTTDDTILYTNSSRSYQIKWDIASAERNNDSINLSFDNKSEYIVVDEKSTWYRTIIAGSFSTQYNLGASAIELGDFSIVRDTTASSQTVAKNTNDVLLMAGTIKPGQAVTMENITVNLTGSINPFASGATRVKLVVGETSAVMDAASSVTFQNTYSITKETPIKVYADIKADATAGTYYATSLSVGTIRYASNDQTVSNPTNALSSNTITVTVSAPTVTISNNGAPSTAQTVIGAKDLVLSKIALANNNLSDVTVSNLTFNTGSSTWSGAWLNDTTVYLFVNGEQKESRKIKDGSLQFTSTTFKVAKGATTNLELKVSDISSSYGTWNVQLSYNTGSFVDVSGNSVDVTGAPSGTLFTLNGKGSATFAILPTDNQAKIITPGTWVQLGKFTVNATNDTVKLLDLYASFSGVTDASKYVSNIKLVSGTSEFAGSIVWGTLKFTSVNSGNGIEVVRGADPISLVIKWDVLPLASANDGTALELKLGASNVAHVDDSSNVADSAAKFRSAATSQYLVDADVTTPTTAISANRVANSMFTIVGAAGTTNDEHRFTVIVPKNLSRIALSTIDATISTGSSLTGTLYIGSVTEANKVADWSGTGFTLTGASTTNSTVVLNADSTTTFILKLSGVTSSNNANSVRTLNITGVSYKDYVDGTYSSSPLSTSSYINVGLPVSSSTTY